MKCKIQEENYSLVNLVFLSKGEHIQPEFKLSVFRSLFKDCCQQEPGNTKRSSKINPGSALSLN